RTGAGSELELDRRGARVLTPVGNSRPRRAARRSGRVLAQPTVLVLMSVSVTEPVVHQPECWGHACCGHSLRIELGRHQHATYGAFRLLRDIAQVGEYLRDCIPRRPYS